MKGTYNFCFFPLFSLLFPIFFFLIFFPFFKILGGGAITSQNMGVGHMPTSPPSEYVPEQKEPKLRHKSYSGKVKIYIFFLNLGPKRLRQSSWSKISLTGKMIKGLVWVSYLRFFYIHLKHEGGKGGGGGLAESHFLCLSFLLPKRRFKL